MAYDLEEQEQLDELKAWWKRNGNTVMAGFTALALAYAGYQGWNIYQNKQSVAASVRYDALTKLDPKDTKAIQSASAELMEQYAGTPYASRAALLAAKVNYQAGDAKSAQAQVEWVVKNAKEEPLRAIGQLQLASFQYEEKGSSR